MPGMKEYHIIKEECQLANDTFIYEFINLLPFPHDHLCYLGVYPQSINQSEQQPLSYLCNVID